MASSRDTLWSCNTRNITAINCPVQDVLGGYHHWPIQRIIGYPLNWRQKLHNNLFQGFQLLLPDDPSHQKNPRHLAPPPIQEARLGCSIENVLK